MHAWMESRESWHDVYHVYHVLSLEANDFHKDNSNNAGNSNPKGNTQKEKPTTTTKTIPTTQETQTQHQVSKSKVGNNNTSTQVLGSKHRIYIKKEIVKPLKTHKER